MQRKAKLIGVLSKISKTNRTSKVMSFPKSLASFNSKILVDEDGPPSLHYLI